MDLTGLFYPPVKKLMSKREVSVGKIGVGWLWGSLAHSTWSAPYRKLKKTKHKTCLLIFGTQLE